MDAENTYLTIFWASASKQRWLRMAFKIKAEMKIISSANTRSVTDDTFVSNQNLKLINLLETVREVTP